MVLEAIKFDRSDPEKISVSVLDQLLLPYLTRYVPIFGIDDGYRVIKNMQVRGAPAIAMAGTLSVLLETQPLLSEEYMASQWFYDPLDWASTKKRLSQRLEFLLSSRPTAVNLANSLTVISSLLETADNIRVFRDNLYIYSCELLAKDLENNVRMGENGAKYLLNLLKTEGFHGEFAVLTICNTGSLATAGYGTALGVIRSLWKDSQNKTLLGDKGHEQVETVKMGHVFALETRPYNQGSRLTAYELLQDEIPSTLITDSSIAYKIQTSTIPIKAAFVGADRIVRNGDTANKIGTLQLAVICRQFRVKFFVVAPKNTVDNKTLTGDDIVVEERDADEFKFVTGTLICPEKGSPILDSDNKPITAKIGLAPPQINVWNPSFDVTPYKFIDGIVTEEGVFTKDQNGKFNLDALF